MTIATAGASPRGAHVPDFPAARVIGTFVSPHATVTLAADMVATREGAEVVYHYVVTGSSGYRAVLHGCPCHLDGRKSCDLPYGHSATAKGSAPGCKAGNGTYCHNWHDGSARRFAAEVLATYGAKWKEPKVGGLPRGNRTTQQWMGLYLPHGAQEPRWTVERISEALGLTPDEYRAELAKARLDETETA